MLTDEQEEIISQALVPLFEYLEQEVIRDVAKRISESLAYTRTADLAGEHLQMLGYSPARIRKQAMKILNADAAFRKTVAKNTLDHKREVKKILKQIMKSAARSKKEVLRDAAELAYFNDLKIWKESGNRLTDRSYLPQLVDAISKQTDRMMENLSGTTGFKSMSGFEMLKNLYQRELDKALIKVCSGAFTREQAVIDTIHSLAVSGLRTIDFSSGRTMQLDTAVRLAVRTGAHQLSAKIMDTNMERTGKNLVYVSKHWGARNTGTGHANQEQWQGKVYYIKPIKEYSAEAKRIGQSKIEDLWEATGYSADGSHESDPLGLNGYNCRHRHYMISEGTFDPAKHPDDPEPKPVTLNGKTYDYYAITQKMRAKEREIRGLKREREALKALGFDTKEISTKIKRKIRDYEDFCEAAGVKADINRLRYEGGTSDLTKTEAWKKYDEMSKKSGIIKKIEFPMEDLETAGIGDDQINEIYLGINEIVAEYDVVLDRVRVLPDNDKKYRGVPMFYSITEDNARELLINPFHKLWSNQNQVLLDIEKRKYTSGRNVREMVWHEMAHAITFSGCKTTDECLNLEKILRDKYVPGISRYNDLSKDGSETIAEAFVKMRKKLKVPPEAKKLVIDYVEVRRK